MREPCAFRQHPTRTQEGPQPLPVNAEVGGPATQGTTPKRRKGRRGNIPPRGPLPANAARLRTSPRARNRASIEKRPPRARRPALPQPCAAVLSAKAGLTAGFGMGPGDPRLCGRARGGRSPAAHVFEPARNPCPGRPWRPHGGHGQKIAHRARCFNRGCEELGLLVPLG